MLNTFCFSGWGNMIYKIIFFLVLNNFIYPVANGQIKRLTAVYIKDKVNIDGILDEAFWDLAQSTGAFTQDRPYNGAPSNYLIDARIAFDNNNLYIGALIKCDPGSISRGLGNRDTWPNADFFAVWLDTYNDNLNAYGFVVTASNIQRDVSISSSGYDVKWDAIWYSNTEVLDSGWCVEIKIPYSALRFPAKKNQTWGLNFYYKNHKTQETDSWVFLDQEIAGFVNQFGELKGLTNLKPPIRFAIMPHLSGYASNTNADNFNYSGKYGMDIKYGINQSFTLDMMLIPDFGQVQSDNVILNLGPYEVQYNERRAFFTESANLFNTANIFYSKRIGARPFNLSKADDSLAANEILYNNPVNTNLINATKLSGRTNQGLSLGFINAVTDNTSARIKDTITGSLREYLTQPITNYNVFVVQQLLRNNSQIAFVNTNMYFDDFLANVSAATLLLRNRQNTHELRSNISFSYRDLVDNDNKKGLAYIISGMKRIGYFRYSVDRKYYSQTYNINDLGFLRRNNYSQDRIRLELLTLRPFWRIYRSSNSLNFVYLRRINPSDYLNFYCAYNSKFTFNNYSSVGISSWIRPFDMHDYDETRTEDRYYLDPLNYQVNVKVETDKRKMYSFGGHIKYQSAIENNYSEYSYGVSSELALSDNLKFDYKISFDKIYNKRNYIGKSNGGSQIHFGERDSRSINNILEGAYTLSEDLHMEFKLRHYWSEVLYSSFYVLADNGELIPNNLYNKTEDINFNLFNLDVLVTWRLFPGSELAFAWKNSVFDEQADRFFSTYLNNVRYTMEQPYSNSFSIKVLIYLDYIQVRQFLTNP